MLTLQADRVIPVRSMQQCALIFVESRDSRPLPVVEDTASIDENVAVVSNHRTIGNILDLDIVATPLAIPVGTNYLMLEFDVLMKIVFLRETLEIVENFLCWWIYGGPI